MGGFWEKPKLGPLSVGWKFPFCCCDPTGSLKGRCRIGHPGFINPNPRSCLLGRVRDRECSAQASSAYPGWAQNPNFPSEPGKGDGKKLELSGEAQEGQSWVAQPLKKGKDTFFKVPFPTGTSLDLGTAGITQQLQSWSLERGALSFG